MDNTQRLLPLSNLICKDDFEVKPSIQNLKALRVASGVGTSQELEVRFSVNGSQQFLLDKCINHWLLQLSSKSPIEVNKSVDETNNGSCFLLPVFIPVQFTEKKRMGSSEAYLYFCSIFI